MNGGLPTLAALRVLGPTRAAAVWLERLARIDAGDIEDIGGDRLFEEWLGDDETNQLAWDQALELWDGLAEVGGEAFDGLRSEALSIRPRSLVRSWMPYAVAASIIIAILAALFIGSGRFTSTSQEARVAAKSIAAAEYATRVGQRTDIVLEDGSKVALDTDSAVRVAFIEGVRAARLVRGQALFDVQHDVRRPFRVVAGQRVVSVLGTQFNIRVSKDETRIMLVRGSIAVTTGSDPIHVDEASVQRLAAGDQLIVRTGMPDVTRRFDADASLQWRRGFLQFDGDSLSSAAMELNRYTTRKMVIRDPSVANLRISGAFPTGDTRGFLDTVTTLYPLRVVPRPDGSEELRRIR